MTIEVALKRQTIQKGTNIHRASEKPSIIKMTQTEKESQEPSGEIRDFIVKYNRTYSGLANEPYSHIMVRIIT